METMNCGGCGAPFTGNLDQFGRFRCPNCQAINYDPRRTDVYVPPQAVLAFVSGDTNQTNNVTGDGNIVQNIDFGDTGVAPDGSDYDVETDGKSVVVTKTGKGSTIKVTADNVQGLVVGNGNKSVMNFFNSK